MRTKPEQISLDEWDRRYAELQAAGFRESRYGGKLSQHLADGDLRLKDLLFDNSPAALRLWNFLLTENERLHEARRQGAKIVGTMKDLGTVPVLVYSAPGMIAFYPDGAWWEPCVMRLSDGLFAVADRLGIDESFCPVRAMLGAFITGEHFPIPDLLVCSTGATCDDFSAIAQRLEDTGRSILWWEIPVRRNPEPGEEAVSLPGGFTASAGQVQAVTQELRRICAALEELAGIPLDDEMLARGIREANKVRRLLQELRRLAYSTSPCPMGGLEMLVAEMLAIHYCSDRDECVSVLSELLEEVRRRVKSGAGVLDSCAVPVFVVNPPADLRLMNLLEDCGARVCGTEYMFRHALDEIPENIPPLEGLARAALADPMVGPARQRAQRVCAEASAFGSRAVLICKIPGASHCAVEGAIIADTVRKQLQLPVAEIEVPTVIDSTASSLRTRIQTLVEMSRKV